MALLTYMNNDQIEAAKAEKLIPPQDLIEAEVVDDLAAYIWSCWTTAKG